MKPSRNVDQSGVFSVPELGIVRGGVDLNGEFDLEVEGIEMRRT